MALTKALWFYLPVNPEPWAVGDLSLGKRNGKVFPKMGRNQQLHSYKEAIREAMPTPWEPVDHEVDLYFWFWRRVDRYRGPSGREVVNKKPDSTNMQKATEDALQDILYLNDRQVRKVGSEIVAEDEDVQGGVLIKIHRYVPDENLTEIPASLLKERWDHERHIGLPVEDNVWPPRS